MEPGFHWTYAGRLAWRWRLGLASGLALLGLLWPPFLPLSPLPLLLPARLWERAALRAIARHSLAYPTALAYGEEALWAEARKVRVDLPPFPWPLLALYLTLLLLGLLGLSWRTGQGVPWWAPTPPPWTREAPRPGEGGAAPRPSEASRTVPGETPTPGEAPGPRGKGEEVSPQGTPGDVPPQAKGAETPDPGERAPGTPESGIGREAQAPSGPREGGFGPGPGGEAPALGNPEVPPPGAQGPEAGLLPPGPGEGGEAPPLPPWPQGRPPERVQRGAEVYLERTPLPPEVRDLLRRYFGLE